MKSQQYIVNPKTIEQVSALKALLKTHKIEFKVTTEDNYNPDFVEKILESKKQIAQGEFTEVKRDGLKVFIDSL